MTSNARYSGLGMMLQLPVTQEERRRLTSFSGNSIGLRSDASYIFTWTDVIFVNVRNLDDMPDTVFFNLSRLLTHHGKKLPTTSSYSSRDVMDSTPSW